jgi:signal transduction histidine kinase
MARPLDRIWIRFGLWIAATVLVTIAILGASVMLFSELQYRGFYGSLPENVQQELDVLQDQALEDSPRAMQIYGQYWRGDLLFGEKWSLLIGLLVCLPFGLAAGFWVSRFVTLPLASMAEAAQRVALGDFSVRAEPGRDRGEMADMVNDFNQMTDALEQLERERKATAAAVSHELRTPLAVLRARLHAVCDGVIPADGAEFRTLLDQVEHLGRLVDDLHMLSMAEAGGLSLQTAKVDLAVLVQDTVAGYASRLAEHGIVPELDIGEEHAWVHADPDRMRQVISNLTENVLRYARDGAWLGIRLRSEVGAAMVVLTISDAGAGLPEDVRQNLFQRFQRSDNSRSRATGGSGLGLSIVHMLVARQGGSVAVDRSSRGGTRFTICMPLLMADRRSAPSVH